MLHSNINERRGVSYTVYADFGLVTGSLTKHDREIQKNAEEEKCSGSIYVHVVTVYRTWQCNVT